MQPINIVFAVLVYYLLGALWFGPLCGRAWAVSLGCDATPRFPMSYYVVPAVGSSLTTAVSAALLAIIGGGLATGATVGLCVGVAAAATSMTNAFVPTIPRPFLFSAVTGGYHLLGATLGGLVLGF